MRSTVFGALVLLSSVGFFSAQQAPTSSGTAVLWRDPGAIGEKDLRWGAGGPDRQPAPPFTFVKEDVSGSKPKARITDARGVAWNVKFPAQSPQKNEVHPEVAANRFVWAMGYFAEEDYYLASGAIAGAGRLSRATPAVSPDGSFRTARFERRPSNAIRSDRMWTLDRNPFVGSRELSGLKIVLALLNNWDNKPDNTVVETVTTDAGIEERYLFSDWGSSFGRMAGPPSWSPAPTRWHVQDYKQQPLTRGVAAGILKLHYEGQVPIDGVPLEHAQWFATLAGQLRAEQARAAFEAAGAPASDAEGFAARLMEKIDELRSAVQSSAIASHGESAYSSDRRSTRSGR